MTYLRSSAASYLRLSAALVSICGAAVAAQQPVLVDTSKIGPAIGAVAPDFSGVDQSGTPRTLKSVAGPKGTMLVFFRSADW